MSGTWKKDLDLGPTGEGLYTMVSVSFGLSSLLQRSESSRSGSCCEFGRVGGREDFQILVSQASTKFGSTIAT